MKCSNCNKEIPENSNLCRFCGEKQKEVNVLANSEKEKLAKRYKDTGNSSIALSIFGFVASILVSLSDYSVDEILLGTLILFPFYIPFFYYGQKLKTRGIDNLEYALKVSKGMLIYTIIFVVGNLLLGGIGWLWLFLLYYFYKSYKETKEVLK